MQKKIQDIWAVAALRWQTALSQGSLVPMETSIQHKEQEGISFILRKVETLKHKPRSASGASGDPFAPPYDPDLLVGEVSPTHVALLNKFPALSEHLLLVTRDYADQRELLNEADFAALSAAMDDRETLGFYNGGPEAGASQPHKHLQVVPLPLGDDGEQVPLEPFVGRLPFLHAVADLKGKWPIPGASLLAIYHRLWRACGFTLEGEHQPVPYNLLLTRRRMWLVPRSWENREGIEVNALGFAGALLAKDVAQEKLISRVGPLTLLHRVAREGNGVFLNPQ